MKASLVQRFQFWFWLTVDVYALVSLAGALHGSALA